MFVDFIFGIFIFFRYRFLGTSSTSDQRQLGWSAESGAGAVHGTELDYVFGRPASHLGESNSTYSEDDISLSLFAMKAWSNFAKFG